MTNTKTLILETNLADLGSGPCAPVGLEIGGSQGLDPSMFGEFPDTFADLSRDLEAANVRRLNDLETGEAAKRTMVALGCGTCVLKETCTVAENLQAHVEVAPKLHMLATAPTWLNAARLNQSGVDERLLATTEATQAAVENGELDLDTLLAGVTNESLGTIKRNDVPELQKMTGINPDKTLTGHRVTTELGDVFDVIDASDATNFKGPKLELPAYKVLTGKLLQRMKARGAKGDPQILTPDQIMQKPITYAGDTEVDELRMNGKNRLYIVVNKGDPTQADAVPRITILGGHGSNAAAQQQFIDNIINSR